MIKERFVLVVSVLLIIVLSILISMTFLRTSKDSVILIDDFEKGMDDWFPRGTESIQISKEESYSGKNSLKVSKRTETWNGPSCSKTDKLKKGLTYDFSIWVKYSKDSYPNIQNFNLVFKYNDKVKENFINLSSDSVTKGSWTLIEGECTIPKDSTKTLIIVETPSSNLNNDLGVLDFYIDNFSVSIAEIPKIEHEINSLKKVYIDYFKIGGMVTSEEIEFKPTKDLFNKHYDCVTLGKELKPEYTLDYEATISNLKNNKNGEVNPQVNLKAAKKILDFARDNDMPVRGSSLIQETKTPDWFFRKGYAKDTSVELVSKKIAIQRMENYIKNLMGLIKNTYPDVKFYAWDVVDEDNNQRTVVSIKRYSLWMETVGSEYIEKAFEYARLYTPENCKLFYNKYEVIKSEEQIDNLKNLREKGLLDGVGIQSHWTMNYPGLGVFETAVREYTELGLEVQLTELNIMQPDGSNYAMISQAERYRLLFSKLIDLKDEGLNISTIVFGGVADAATEYGGYPLLFDKNYKAKPAFYSIIGVLNPVEIPEEEVGRPIVSYSTEFIGNGVNQNYIISSENGTIDLSKLKLVYSADGISDKDHNIWCDYAGLQLNVAPYSVHFSNDVKGVFEDSQFTITIENNKQLKTGKGRLNINMRFSREDWAPYTEFSNEMLEVYYDGILIVQ